MDWEVLTRMAAHTQVPCRGAQLHGCCSVRIMAGCASEFAIDQGQVTGYPHRNDINYMFTAAGAFGVAVDTK